MDNQVFVGERLALAGQLKNGSTVLTPSSNYKVFMQTFRGNCSNPFKEEELTFDAQTSKYGCSIDTSAPGYLRFRFIVRKTDTGDIVINNGDIGVSIIK